MWIPPRNEFMKPKYRRRLVFALTNCSLTQQQRQQQQLSQFYDLTASPQVKMNGRRSYSMETQSKQRHPSSHPFIIFLPSAAPRSGLITRGEIKWWAMTALLGYTRLVLGRGRGCFIGDREKGGGEPCMFARIFHSPLHQGHFSFGFFFREIDVCIEGAWEKLMTIQSPSASLLSSPRQDEDLCNRLFFGDGTFW